MTRGELAERAREILGQCSVYPDSAPIFTPSVATPRYGHLRAILLAFIGDEAPADAGKPQICVECRFRELTTAVRHCEHPHSIDIVTGKLGQSCYDMRAPGGACGPEGRLYEPK